MGLSILETLEEVKEILHKLDKQQALLIQSFEQHKKEAEERDQRISEIEDKLTGIVWLKQTGGLVLWFLALIGSISGVVQVYTSLK